MQRCEAPVICFDQALTLDSYNILALANREHALNDPGKFSEAIACFEGILKTSSGHPSCDDSKKASHYGNRRAKPKRWLIFDAVLSLKPLHSFVWQNRAGALRNIRRMDEAEESEKHVSP